jgi:hypothetical protein
MDTLLYTSDIEGIHNRIDIVLNGKKDNIDLDIDNKHDKHYNVGLNIDLDIDLDLDIDYKQDKIEEVIDETANEEDKCESPVLKKQYDKLTSSEMRMCEMEMSKYKMMLVQHKYERGFRKKASILERELKSKTVIRECATLKEFSKALDVSHSKWTRCSGKMKEKYIKEFVYNEYGFPIYKKTGKGSVSAKQARRTAFKMESINLNTIDIGNNDEDNEAISINVSTLTYNPVKANKNKTKTKTKTKTIKQEIPEETINEIKATLEKYLENLNNSVYDNPDNIQYDPKKKRIIKLECNENKSDSNYT